MFGFAVDLVILIVLFKREYVIQVWAADKG